MMRVLTTMGMLMTPKEKRLAAQMGKAIAFSRQQKGLTQAELAEKIDVEQQTISRFERGVTLPPLGRLVDIADVLSCPLEDLVRVGSSRRDDKAQAMARAFENISDADLLLVSDMVEQLCSRLAKGPTRR